MAFHDAFQQNEKEAIHEKLIQDDFQNTTCPSQHLATKLMAIVINPQHNPTYAILDNGCTRSMGSWHATQRFTQATEAMKDPSPISASRARASSHLPMERELRSIGPCVSNLLHEQGAVPIRLSVSQMRNLYMTIEPTPQCDK